MIEIKMIAGAFLTIGITGAVISITMNALPEFAGFMLMGIVAITVIFKAN
jgi:hypothetical protein